MASFSYEQTFLHNFEKAKDLNLCPNRLWNSAEDLDKILPDLDLIERLNKSSDGLQKYNSENDHSNCTTNLCEYSKRDFTSVQQRHECTESETCKQLHVSFRARILEDAVNNDQSTVWALDRESMLKSPLPYMAISHVWSDGTGAGPLADGSVNDCLFRYFANIATQFHCDGIWWDTICIPQDKATRSKAIRKIHLSYENARFTLVHDCFLRNWPWGPDTACFAILMSPWFSRGWTALELSKSSKVKVVFKGPNGPLMKDLDEEILAKESDPDGPRKEASRIIRRLRHGIQTVNDLLSVLKSRSTSWPKDIHVIAALLLDMVAAQGQQDTYRRILKKVGKICPGHLFHNAMTMSNSFTWCPAELMEMPLDPSNPSLSVLNNGDVQGRWLVSAAPEDLVTRCSLSSLNGLTRLRLKDAIRHSTECRLLMECDKLETDSERALVVRQVAKRCFQYIAAVNFYPGLIPLNSCEEMEVTILSNPLDVPAGKLQVAQPDIEANEKRRPATSNGESLNSAIWNRDIVTFNELLSPENMELPDELGRQPLHLAAERGSCVMVERLLTLPINTGALCDKGQTALHKAAWAGSTDTVKILLNSGMPGVHWKDKRENTALHIAAQMGFAPIVELLATPDTINIKCANGLTALHLAAMNGDIEVAKLLMGSSLEAKDDHFGWTPLHCAADSGNEEVVRLLLDHGANIQASDSLEGWTPLHLASMTGNVPTVKLLLDRQAPISVPDKHNWTARKFAELNEHAEVLALFPGDNSYDVFQDTPFPPDASWTSLHCRAINNQPGLTKILTEPDISMYVKDDSKGWTPLKFSARANLGIAFERLLGSRFSSRMVQGSNLLHWAIKQNCHSATVSLLKAGYGVEAVDNRGQSPLHCATRFADGSMVQILLDAGADKYSTTQPMKETVLHTAAMNKRSSALRLLLEHGLEIEAKDLTGSTPLLFAARVGNEAAVHFLLEAGAKIDAADDKWKTAIMYASEIGSAAVVDYLIRAGAEIEFKLDVDTDNSYEEMTAFQLACMNGHENVAKLLIHASANFNSRGRKGLSAIHLAAQGGHERVMRLLIDVSADIEKVSELGDTALVIAARENHENIVRLLISIGANTAALGAGRSSAFLSAIKRGHGGIVKMLIDAGVDPNQNSPDDPDNPDPFDERSPFLAAVEGGHKEIAQILIQAGADVNQINRYAHCPLSQAAVDGHEDIIRMIIDAGGNLEPDPSEYPDWYFHLRKSPLTEAIRKGHIGIVQILIQAGAHINGNVDYRERRPLYDAAKYGHDDIVQILIDAGADPGSQDPPEGLCGNTPLCQAASRGHEGIVRILIKAGAWIELRDDDECTPLLNAAMKGHESIVRFLIQGGANLEAKTPKGYTKETPWEEEGPNFGNSTSLILAIIEKHDSVARNLIQAGANIEARGPLKGTAIVWAASKGNDALVGDLIRMGADLEARDSSKRTALHHAAYNDDVSSVRCLLEAGADPRVRDCDRNTPYDLAFSKTVQRQLALERLGDKVKGLWSRHVRLPSTNGTG